MITTDDADLAARARHLTTQAKTPDRGYHHDEVGYNYRLTNVAAALGVAQLEQLPAFLARKRQIVQTYRQALRGLPVSGPPQVNGASPSFWLVSVLLEHGAPDREVVLDRLAAEGVQARALWPPLHQQQPYRDAPRLGGSVADDLYGRGLSLPCSVGLTEEQQRRVVDALHRALT